jgi:hypothetical protein
MVVGPDVALAHRLQEATFDLNASIVASRATVEPVEDVYNLVPVSGVPLNGVRALLDASIVRGRKRGDKLMVPKAGAFATTVVDESVPGDALEPREIVPFDVAADHAALPGVGDPAHDRLVAPATSAAAADVAPPPAEATEFSAPLKTRRRSRPDTPPAQQQFGLDLPELRMPAFAQSDEGPIYPDPPPPRATYEDNDGPPLPL